MYFSKDYALISFQKDQIDWSKYGGAKVPTDVEKAEKNAHKIFVTVYLFPNLKYIVPK